jgi:Uma2 family endonuclease
MKAEDPKKRPTLVVEYLTPDEHAGNVIKRAHNFLEAGVQLVWMIDPDARDVTVYRAGAGSYVVEAGQEITGDDVLPDFRCRVAEFFFSPEEEPGGAA